MATAMIGMTIVIGFTLVWIIRTSSACELQSGPSLLRRLPYPLSLPDGIWVLHLVSSVYLWIIQRQSTFPPTGWVARLAFADLLLFVLAILQYKTLCSWSRQLPAYARLIADHAVQGPIWRMFIRLMAWQGLLMLCPGTPTLTTRAAWLVPLCFVLLAVFSVWSVLNMHKFICALLWHRGILVHGAGAATRCMTSDWFFSYKSDDANQVRAMVDLLLSAGVHPWFAEYTIRFFSRDRFQDAINSGIAGTRRGALFTSDLYAQSPHCYEEWKLLLQRHVSQSRFSLKQVRMSDGPVIRELHERYLSHLEYFRYIGSIEGAISFLDPSAARRIASQARNFPSKPNPLEVCAENIDVAISLDADGWRVISAKKADIGEVSRFVAVLRSEQSPWRSKLNIVITRYSDLLADSVKDLTRPLPVFSQAGLPPQLARLRSGEDDRQLCASLRNFEMLRTALTGEQCVGFHLYHCRGYGYPMLTFWSRGAWVRRYYLLLGEPESAQAVQVRMDFVFYGPLSRFLRYSTRFDRSVESIQLLRVGSLAPIAKTVSADPPKLASLRNQADQMLEATPDEWKAKTLVDHAYHLVEQASFDPSHKTTYAEEALRLLDKATNLAPDYSRAHHEKAYVLAMLSRYSDAFKVANEALRGEPLNPKYRNTCLSIQLDALISSKIEPDTEVPGFISISHLAGEIEELIASNPQYPSGYLTRAEFRAARGAPQSVWEDDLTRASECFRKLVFMSSGANATPAIICHSLYMSNLICCMVSR